MYKDLPTAGFYTFRISMNHLTISVQEGWLMVLPISVEEQMCTRLVAQLSLTLCDPMDSSPAGSSVPGILQARILEWVAMPSSRGSSRPRDWNWVSYISCIGRQILYHWCHLDGRSQMQCQLPSQNYLLFCVTLLRWERCAHISLPKVIRNAFLVMQEGTEEAAHSPRASTSSGKSSLGFAPQGLAVQFLRQPFVSLQSEVLSILISSWLSAGGVLVQVSWGTKAETRKWELGGPQAPKPNRMQGIQASSMCVVQWDTDRAVSLE